MDPVQPHWHQPSHPDVQQVIVSTDGEFACKSISKIVLPPFAVFAKLEFPPCTPAEKATYATVQHGADQHLNLESDMLYINHSCEPSLIFDTSNFNILAGPKGLQLGQELTFFYPSTEWDMAQPFTCLCGEESCRGTISGAGRMAKSQLEGVWLNGHIRQLLEERDSKSQADRTNGTAAPGNGAVVSPGREVEDVTTRALRDAVRHAEKVVEAARLALRNYTESSAATHANRNGKTADETHAWPSGPGSHSAGLFAAAVGCSRRGPTSRELSGEMGGDTRDS